MGGFGLCTYDSRYSYINHYSVRGLFTVQRAYSKYSTVPTI